MNAPERSLDPDDWPAYRALAHETLDAALDAVATLRDRPVWQPVPVDILAELRAPCPVEARGAHSVLADVRRCILPYTSGNAHPRFWGWVQGTGTVGGILSAMLTAALNANVGGRDHAAVYVERQVIGWFREIFGLPATASGLLVSGSSLATLVALAVARGEALHTLGIDVRRDGLLGAPALVAYTSTEAHVSVRKAVEILGHGSASLRAVPVDGSYRMDLTALAAMVARDRADGRRPYAVIATAGTVNTGAIDNLTGIADLCAREGLWLHVDGAFGALARLAPALSPRVDGIHRADSLAFDLHKWLHVPYDAGCVLIRHEEAHARTFAAHPDYLAVGRALAGGEPWFCDRGPELSRSFRALNVWWTLREHGLRRLGEKIRDNCRQAQYLADRIAAHPALSLAAPVSLNIVCFRYVGDGTLTDTALDDLQGAIAAAVQLSGVAAPSTTRLMGRTVLRVAITNHRSRLDDFDCFVTAVLTQGRTLTEHAS